MELPPSVAVLKCTFCTFLGYEYFYRTVKIPRNVFQRTSCPVRAATRDLPPAAALFLICLSAVGIYASMGVWWTIPTTFLSGSAAAGSIALINSCGNLGGWVGPYMMGWIKTNTGSFDLGYYLMGAFMCAAGLLVLTIRRDKAK